MSKKEKPAAPVTLAAAIGDQSGPHVAPAEPAPAIVTHRIAATPERGFYRAGRYWPREEVLVDREDFTVEQWAALEAEPRLVVSSL